MENFDLEERIQTAVRNFESGYNCAQSVFLTYADLLNLDLETAKRMSVSFGGGVGRMREVCGTISALAMLTGFRYPVADTTDQEARTRNYAMVQRAAGRFKEKYGTIICRDLLPPDDAASTHPAPDLRTQAYYGKRPCGKYVAEAARIAGEMLRGELETEEGQASK